MKYLKPIRELCTYHKNANLTIEPTHANYFNMIIPHLPINQSLRLDSVFTINVKIPFLNKKDGTNPVSKFIWSNNLKTSQETLNSVKDKPFLECVHFGAIDIGSELKGKFIVSEIDLELMQSYSLFGFSWLDKQKEFILWIYNYYNSIEQLHFVIYRLKSIYSEIEFIKPSNDVKIQPTITFTKDGYNCTVFINEMINLGIMRMFIYFIIFIFIYFILLAKCYAFVQIIMVFLV
jgi:hypothetical protein